MTNMLERARSIAKKELGSCYRKNGIVAGLHHFTDYWARDGYFAALGALVSGNSQVVKNMLKLFYKHQRSDGLIPYRIMRGPVTIGKYLGKPTFFKKLKATYRLRGFGGEVLDGTSLTILFTSILGQKGWSGAKIYVKQIRPALDFLTSKEKHGLLVDSPMTEWHDSIWKWGNSLYSNIIYWYAHQQLEKWLTPLNPQLAKSLGIKKKLIARSLRQRLWNGRYFADWYDYKRQDFFNPFCNCLAIVWGLTTKSEAASILAECKTCQIGFGLSTSVPQYPLWRVDLFQGLIGMANYHRSILWWQPILAYIGALKKIGYQKEANKISLEIAKKIVNDKAIYECYNKEGKFINKLMYRAEQPFAWAAGMAVWALGKNNKKT